MHPGVHLLDDILIASKNKLAVVN